MFLKLMGGRDLADLNNSKEFRLIECKDVSFSRQQTPSGERPFARVDGVDFELEGNAYLLNTQGKTIDSFAHSYCPSAS